jgi:hypothetical protein
MVMEVVEVAVMMAMVVRIKKCGISSTFHFAHSICAFLVSF